MIFSVTLYAALLIFTVGLLYKMTGWLTRSLGLAAQDTNFSQRGMTALKGTINVLFSRHIGTLLKVLILDVFFQHRIAREDFLRWLMHFFIFTGFILLILMHALEPFVTEALFTDYYSTINPFFFLRNLFGTMVIAGVLIALYRRFVMKIPRLTTRPMDIYTILIVAVIIVSGFLLEGMKITSYESFQEMTEDYAGLSEDEADYIALENYWVVTMGTVSPRVKAPFDLSLLESGLELHQESCIECHSATPWAFGGFITAQFITPLALQLDRAGFGLFLWYVHFLACFIGLAYLPFSKMFHMVTTPLSLMINSVSDPDALDSAVIANRQALEVDACTQCGTCSLRCSAAAAFDVLGNAAILPAEKMLHLKKFGLGNQMHPNDVKAIRQGLYLCSNCDRCTVVCPSGINLKEMWFQVREELIQSQGPDPLMLSPFSFYRGLNKKRLTDQVYIKPLRDAHQEMSSKNDALLKNKEPISLEPEEGLHDPEVPAPATFNNCFGCQTCTTVCPVVAVFESPEAELDLLPHQLMNCMALGLTDMAVGARMIWDCSTCYLCQEHCPQEVEITDLFYNLKNLAAADWTESQTEDSAQIKKEHPKNEVETSA